jgi:hypothetical protein
MVDALVNWINPLAIGRELLIGLLERLYTAPKRLEIAKACRQARHNPKNL